MASNDIKSTHDENPTGCDDVTADYYIQVVKDDGTTSDEGMSVPQLRSILQIDPGAARDVFSMSIPDNTLEAVVGTLFGDYTHWQLLESDVEPVYTDVNWNTWPMSTIFNVAADPDVPVLSDWNSKAWHLYTKDTSVVHTILSAAGDNGILISPRDTLSPVFPTIGLALTANVANPATAVDWEVFAPTDPAPGTGLASTYSLLKIVDDLPLVSEVAAAQLTGTIAGFIPESVVGLYAKWDDLASPSNIGISNNASITLGSSTAGTVQFTSNAFEEVEDSTPMAITLERVNGSTGAVSVTVTTLDHTAIDGTNYTGVTTQTVNFADTITSAIVNISLTAIPGGSVYNNMFEIQIDAGSATGGVVIGTVNAALCKILSSASGTTGWQQDTLGDQWLVLEAENADVKNVSSSPATPTGEDWGLVAPADGPSNNAYESSTGLTTQGDSTTMQEGTAYLNWTVNWAATVTMYGWVRARTVGGTSSDNVHLNTDNADNNATSEAGLLGFKVVVAPPKHYWKWYNVNSSAAVRSFSATAGAGSVQACVQNAGFNLDKIAFTSNAAADPNTLGAAGFDPAIDGNMGPVESVEGGDVTDNPDNPLLPSDPPPAGTISADRLQPFDNSTMSLTSDTITSWFDGAGNISVSSAQVQQSGNAISGSYNIGSTDGSGYIRFKPSAPLTKAAVYNPVFQGTLIDSNGDPQSFDTTGWSFTVIDPTHTNVHLYEDFNQYTAGHLYTEQDVIDNFAAGVLGYPDSVTHGPDYGTMMIVDDPTGQANMGNVLRCTHRAGTTQSDSMNFRADVVTQGGDSDYTEMYCSVKMYIPPGHIWPDAHKFPSGLGTGSLLEMSHAFGDVPAPEGLLAFTAIGEVYGGTDSPDGAPVMWGGPNGSHGTFFYDANETQKPDWWSNSDPTAGWESGGLRPSDFNILTEGRWVHFERYVSLNSILVEGVSGNSDGIDRGWLDGILKLNVTDHVWRYTASMIIDGGWIYDHYNYQNALQWAPLPRDEYIYFKDFVWSKVPVGNNDTF